MKKKKYRFCHAIFYPHPRVRSRQKICWIPPFKTALKAEDNALWRKNNLECCHCDYDRLKEWLKLHPDYLKNYPQNHPDYVQKNRKAQELREQKKRVRLDIQARLIKQFPDITE